MTTATALLLLVGAASTIAFTPPEASRARRGAADGSKAGSSSSSSSFSTSGSTSGSGAGFGGNAGGFGPYAYYPQPQQFHQQFVPFDFQAAFRQYFDNLQRMAEQQNAYATNFFGPGNGGNSLDSGYGGFGGASSGSFSGFGGLGGYGSPQAAPAGFAGPGAFAGHGAFGGSQGPSDSGSFGSNPAAGAGSYGENAGGNVGGETSDGSPVGAQASVNLDTRGGFAEASLTPDLGSRIAQDIPPPSGSTFGVFTSSSSGSSDINGQKTSFKTATVGVNDNGKVTTFTV